MIRKILFCALLALFALPACARRPSIVLVVLDSVRADRTSPYGYLKSATPALGGFARSASVFENAYANSNWTGASFASMLTGKTPFSHGLLGIGDRLPETAETMQSALARAGYETAAFLTGPAAGYGLPRGFGHVSAGPVETPMAGHVEAALKWKRALPPGQDYFLLLHGYDAHHPYDCPGGDAALRPALPPLSFGFLSYYNNAVPEARDLSALDPTEWKKALSYKTDPAFLPALSGAYDLCVSRLDSAVASLLGGLKADKTRPLLVIITSDHGELLGEHGRLNHGFGFYEPLARVPLLIRFPAAPGGRRVAALAQHIDLLPTVCAAAGVACPEGLDGEDLASPAEKGAAPRRWAAASGARLGSRTAATSSAFLADGVKLAMFNGRWKLFDLAADPGETKDLAEQRPADFMELADGYFAASGAGSVVMAAPPAGNSVENCFYRAARPAETASGDKQLAELLAQAGAGQRALDLTGYEFSARPGRWEVKKGGFAVSYGPAEGLGCAAAGLPSSAAGCVPAAAALLSCVEMHRFAAAAAENPPDGVLEKALRKAGYIR